MSTFLPSLLLGLASLTVTFVAIGGWRPYKNIPWLVNGLLMEKIVAGIAFLPRCLIGHLVHSRQTIRLLIIGNTH